MRVQALLPCNKTNSTVDQKGRVLIVRESDDFQILLSLLGAVQAKAIRFLMPAAVLLIRDPRYVHSFTTSNTDPSLVFISTWLGVLETMTFVFLE